MEDLDDQVFVRVYRLPDRLTDGYCFGGGRPIVFTNVDWFNASISMGKQALILFIRQKNYFSEKGRYLVLSDHPFFTFVMEPLTKAP